MNRFMIFSALLITVTTPARAEIGFGLGAAVAKHDAAAINEERTKANTLNLPACTGEEYTVSPIDLSTTFYLDPLGHMSGVGGHMFPTDHIYFYVPKATDTTPTTNVYAPGAVTIYQVASSRYLHANPPFTDYTLRFSPCRGLNGYYYHVNELSPSLMSKIGAINQSCYRYPDGSIDYCTKSVIIPLNAGDLVGSITGRVGSTFTTLDFGAYDTNQPALTFISPARLYTNEQYTRCPIEPYTEPLRSQLSARFGKYDGTGLRTAPPVCGEIAYDVPGSAQGLWYVPGTPQSTVQDVSPHLALVRDNVLPSTGVFSVGTSMSRSGLAGGQHSFNTQTTGHINLEFNRVAADGSVYCYEGFQTMFNSIILVQLTSATTLRMERQTANSCGAGPWAFTGNASDFQR